MICHIYYSFNIIYILLGYITKKYGNCLILLTVCKKVIFTFMEKIKKIFFVICFVLFGLTLDLIRIEYKIPITLIDLILFPISITILFFFFKWLISKKNDNFYLVETSLKVLLFNFLVFSVIVIPLGIWTIWAGMIDPLKYFSGIKGAAHGYTLVSTGFLLLICWLYFAWQIYRKLISRNN